MYYEIFNLISDSTKKIGVYQIKNNLNNRIYVGSSINLYGRFMKHISMLKRNKHVNKYLQNDWNKCGEENFHINILEFCNKQNVSEKEQEYLDRLYDEQNMCYNIKSKVKGSCGWKHSEESKNKMSEKKKGIKLSQETCKKMSLSRIGKKCHSEERKNLLKKRFLGVNNPSRGKNGSKSATAKIVFQYTLEGIFLKKYGSVIEASIETGACKTSISNCCNGNLKKACNFLWSYEIINTKDKGKQ